MPNFTAQTKIPENATQLMAFLDAYAQEFGVVERILFSALIKRENISSFEKVLQVERRLSSQDVRNALNRAESLHKSQKELIGNYIKDSKNAISSIKDSIKKYEKKIKLLKKQGKKDSSKTATLLNGGLGAPFRGWGENPPTGKQSPTTGNPPTEASSPEEGFPRRHARLSHRTASGLLKGIPSLERAIHQKRRKLARKEAKLRYWERIQESGHFSVCFGSKKLFKAQHNLGENGYKSHQEWLSDWRSARSNHIFYEGSKRFNSGRCATRLLFEKQASSAATYYADSQLTVS